MFAMFEAIMDKKRRSAVRRAKDNDEDIEAGTMTCNVREDVYLNIFFNLLQYLFIYILLQRTL
jgi:hypothetical protein